MRILKTIGGAGALVGAALIGGTLIGSAFAAPAATPTTNGSTATTTANGAVDDEYVDTFLDTLAQELGVDRSALGPAALAAANAVIDAKVAAGDLDADTAATLKERLANLDNPETLLRGHGPLGRGPGGMGHGPGMGVGPFLGEAADAAAGALGIDRGALVQALRDGKALEDIASDEGVAYDTVKAAILGVVDDELASRVADEDITQERADAIRDRVSQWLDDGGDPADGFFGRHRGPRF